MAAYWQSAEAEEGELICDFCASATAAWIYPAESFLDQHGSRSVEDWAACEECHALIERGDRDRLAAIPFT